MAGTYWRILTDIPRVENAVFKTNAWGFIIGDGYAEGTLSCQIQSGTWIRWSALTTVAVEDFRGKHLAKTGVTLHM
jgi:hypothetical protein